MEEMAHVRGEISWGVHALTDYESILHKPKAMQGSGKFLLAVLP